MSRSPDTGTTGTGNGTGNLKSSAASPPQTQSPEQVSPAPRSDTLPTRRRSSAAIRAEQLQLKLLGLMPQRRMSNAIGFDEVPSTSPSGQRPGSRRNSQPFLQRHSVASNVPLPPDPNDLFMRVQFDGIINSF